MINLIRREVPTASFIAVCCITWLTPVHADLTPPLVSREIVSTGDEIRGFGRIGTPELWVGGIDGRDRVLFGAQLTDGRLGLFLGDGFQIETVWTSSENDPHLQIHAAKISESGRIVAPSFIESMLYSLPGDLFEVRNDEVHRLVGPGDLTAEGDVICQIGEFAMNEAGAVAIWARAALSLGACDTSDAVQAIYLIGDRPPRRLFMVSFADPVLLIGVTGDGYAVIGRYLDSSIVATDGIETYHLVENGKPMSLIAAGANAAGQVAFLAYDEPTVRLYLVVDGALREISSTLGATPEGDPITSFGQLDVDGSGNVLVSVQWSTSDDIYAPRGFGFIRYSPDGEETFFGSQVSQPQLNRAGRIAGRRHPERGAADVVRWTDEDQTLIVDGSSPAPHGGWYAYDGIFAGCMSREGLIGYFASTIDSRQGLLCADANGAHPLAVIGEPPAERFNFFLECRFSGEALFFTASEGELGERFEETFGVYVADRRGFTRLIGPGDAITDGGHLDRLRYSGNGFFATNDSGSVVVAALTDSGVKLLLLRKGGMLEALPTDVTDVTTGTVLGLGITADDTVIAIIDPPHDDTEWDDDDEDDDSGNSPPMTLLAVDEGGSRVLAMTGDPTLPGGPYQAFNDLWVRGNLAWFTATDSDGLVHVLQYDFTASRLREIELPALQEGFVRILSTSSGGRILYETETYQPTLRRTRRLIDANGVVELVSDAIEASEPEPVTFNDAGHVLLNVLRSPLGGQRTTLSLAGPDVSARCSQSGTKSTSDDDGCQLVAPRKSTVGWPLLLMAFLVLAGRIYSASQRTSSKPTV